MTHATVGVLNGTRLDSVYVHSSGFLSCTGKKLLENYNTARDVNDLVRLGDLSSVGCYPRTSVAYHRDRKEPLNIKHTDVPDGTLETAFKVIDQGIRRRYIFADGQWYFFKAPPHFEGEVSMEKPMLLAEAMKVEGLDI